jgi:peptide/nickel transport system substrate-binding protein
MTIVKKGTEGRRMVLLGERDGVLPSRWSGGGARASGCAFGIFVAFLLVASIPPVMPAGDAEAEAMTTLRYGMVQSIDSLNPFIGVNDNAYIFYGLVYDYLISVDEDLNVVPNLATSWHPMQDREPLGSVWEYNLTEHAYWHDGEEFNADDVVFTINYQIGENWVNMWAYQPNTILIDYVEKITDYKVRIHFQDFEGNPAPCAFGGALSMPMVPEHIWGEIPTSDAGFSYPNYHPIGTGPFMCSENTKDEFLRGDRLILYRNPDYHGADEYGWEVHFDRLIIERYLEPTAMATDLERGAIDVAAFDAPTFEGLVDRLSKNPNPAVKTVAATKCTGYSIEIAICMLENTFNNLRLDPAVRQAMAHATNKTFIRDHIYKGYAEIGATLLTPVYDYWYWSPSPEEEYYFSIEKANQILDEAGYIWSGDVRVAGAGNLYGVPGQKLQFGIVVEEEIFEDRLSAQYLQEEWSEIGIKLDIELVSSSLWGTKVYGAAFDLTMTYWSGDPDPNYLLYVTSKFALEGWSESFYDDPEYNANYTAQLVEYEPEDRLPYIIGCQKNLYKDCPMIVTVYPDGMYAWREDHFTGWGDWEAHPGREISHFWTAAPIWFELEPVTANEPPMVIIDNVAGPAGEALEITGFAWDPEETEMTYLLTFGDGQETTGTVPSDGEISVSHTYSSPGEYVINLTVTDGTTGSSESAPAVIVDSSAGENAPPSNVRVKPAPLRFGPGEEATFELSGKDSEGDPVTLSLDFGDESTPFEATMQNTMTGFETSTTHQYSKETLYEVVLSASDGQNETSTVLLLVVASTDDGDGGMTTAIIIAAAIIAVVVVVAAIMLLRRRGRKEEEVRLP